MKVSELEGAELDYWVAKADGKQPIEINRTLYLLQADSCLSISYTVWSPSTDWSQGGPLIERYYIDLGYDADETGETLAMAAAWVDGPESEICMDGPTPLIAAMRALVASVYGEEVEDT